MVKNMMVILKTVILTAKELCITQTVINMMVDGKMTKERMGLYITQMAVKLTSILMTKNEQSKNLE